MPSSGYTTWSVTVGEQPTTTKWNLLGLNDGSFNTGLGFNDSIILWRHIQTDMIPTGTIHMYAASAAPSAQWLICDGSAVSRTTYNVLYALIGTTYGVGNGTTTFNLPTFQSRVPVGLNAGDTNFATLGQVGGETNHTLSWSEMPVHYHGVNDPGHNHDSISGAQPAITSGSSTNRLTLSGSAQQITWGTTQTTWNGSNISIQNAGSGGAHNNLQPYSVCQYLIKT
jgi:microcystin-dependent protein